ncbi:OmpH family outer membrane protein [Candidatus Pelagibacter sp.]|nr:OmpH family outer membrane protein [Candidatus Pelagibacter sp.]MDA9890323.1 OmpH family outer membrane protein [Candidatus Pelagibacter sp.]
MNYLNKLSSIFLLFFLFTNTSFSNESVAYIDIDFILKNSDIGKKSLEKINTQNNINIQDLKKKEKILKDLEIEIASKKNIISKEAFDKEVTIFRKNIDQFKIEQQQIIKDFNEYKKKEIDKVFQIISPIINSYMEKNSVKILFDAKNIFMARNDLNFTNDILEAINKEAK